MENFKDARRQESKELKREMRSVKIQGGKVRTEFLSRYDCEHGSRDAGKQESRKAKRCY